jgi:hypothetical protein
MASFVPPVVTLPRRWVPVILVAAALMLLPPAVLGATRDSQARSFPAMPVKPLDIRVPEGSVTIRGEERTDISIVVERELPDPSLAASWPVIIEEAEDHLAVHVLAPPPAGQGIAVKVTVLAPRATPVRLVEIGSGELLVSGSRGLVTATVERGSISGSDIAGILRLETSSGDIRLTRFELRRDGLLRCRTLNGNIAIGLSTPPADARVLLLTMGGTVTSDLPVADRAGFGGRLKEGLIGNAQPLLSLDAVRGNLTVTIEPRR